MAKLKLCKLCKNSNAYSFVSVRFHQTRGVLKSLPKPCPKCGGIAAREAEEKGGA